MAAIGVLLALDADPEGARGALAEFGGVDRRFQTLGETSGVIVVDDYAHHPTEIRATLEAARQVFGDRRVIVVFQPHLYSRTRALADEFGRALARADRVIVTGIYPARESPIPGVSGRLVADAAVQAADGDGVEYVERLDDVVGAVAGIARSGDVILTVGAGDVGSLGPRILDTLGRSHVDA